MRPRVLWRKDASIQAVVRVGTNKSFRAVGQSLNLPAPAIMTSASKPGSAGWLVGWLAESNMNKTDRRPSKRRPVSVPAPTIKAEGLSNANGSQYSVEKMARRERHPLRVSLSAPAPAPSGIGDAFHSQYRIVGNGSKSNGVSKSLYR